MELESLLVQYKLQQARSPVGGESPSSFSSLARQLSGPYSRGMDSSGPPLHQAYSGSLSDAWLSGHIKARAGSGPQAGDFAPGMQTLPLGLQQPFSSLLPIGFFGLFKVWVCIYTRVYFCPFYQLLSNTPAPQSAPPTPVA